MISVVISTLNRAGDLADLLASLAAQDLASDQYEVLVVDNGSRDNTETVAGKAADQMDLSFIREPARGLSYARNSGIKAAKGEIVVFIDDDAIADPGWLTALVEAHRDKSLMCAGGRIFGDWQCERPDWFHPGLDPLLSLLDLGDESVDFHPPSNFPVGTNVSYRKEVFDKYGFFNTSLGRVGAKLSGGEEVELTCRLLADGAKVRYIPAAIVKHKIRSDRVAPKRILVLAYHGAHLAGFLKKQFPIMRASNRQASAAKPPVNAGMKANLFKLLAKSAMAIGYLDGVIKSR